jgi:hypothetical protein
VAANVVGNPSFISSESDVEVCANGLVDGVAAVLPAVGDAEGGVPGNGDVQPDIQHQRILRDRQPATVKGEPPAKVKVASGVVSPTA